MTTGAVIDAAKSSEDAHRSIPSQLVDCRHRPDALRRRQGLATPARDPHYTVRELTEERLVTFRGQRRTGDGPLSFRSGPATDRVCTPPAPARIVPAS